MSERVAVVGSRQWWPPWVIHRMIDTLDPGTTIVSGGAPGADTIAWSFVVGGRQGRYRMDEKAAEWQDYGKAAGPMRNAKIVEDSDWGVAFWDGKVEHSGTLDCVRKFMAAGKCVVVIWNRGSE